MGSKKLRNLSSGRRIAIRSSGEGLVPFVCDFRALSAWVVPSQIDAPDPWVVCATASMESESGRGVRPDRRAPGECSSRDFDEDGTRRGR